MPAKQSTRTPKLRRHKASNRAYVELNGRRIYLGAWGESRAEQEYHRLIAEWMASGRRILPAPNEITVTELCDAYLVFAETYYCDEEGTPTHEFGLMKSAIRSWRSIYGNTKVSEFGPLALKTVRESLIAKDLARTTINYQTRRIKRIVRWGVENEIVPASIYHGLLAVSGLRKGRGTARETDPVTPVSMQDVDAVRPFVSRQVWALSTEPKGVMDIGSN